MGTKESRSQNTWIFRTRFLAFTFGVASLVAAVTAGCNHTVRQNRACQSILDLNREALLSYEEADFEAAEKSLTKALKVSKQANLGDEKLTARTYLHLGAVYFASHQDPTVALRNFTQAKKIRPDIQLTQAIETPELWTIFSMAAVADDSELDLPTTTTLSPQLLCTAPEVSPPGKALSVHCAVQPGVSVKAIRIHYSASGAEAFQTLPMQRTPKGWYMATIPGYLVNGPSMQVYCDARDGNDKEVATYGQFDRPLVIKIHEECAYPDPYDDSANEVAGTGSLGRKRNTSPRRAGHRVRGRIRGEDHASSPTRTALGTRADGGAASGSRTSGRARLVV